MGRDVPAITISRRDRRAYRAKVRTCLDVLARMLRESRFESDVHHVGLEIEFNLVDKAGYPAMTNADVLAAIADDSWGTELAKFNIELAADPVQLESGVFTTMQSSLNGILTRVAEQVEPGGTRLAMIGILPSLREADVEVECISFNPRYRLLNDQILAARGEEMRILIEGQDRLLTYVDSILAEAACTSLQCHLQVSPETFASYWNAAQAIAGIQVALAANSPYLFGQELWRETRITLFEQATDTRPEELREQGVRPRVWFGDRWITSVFDLFEENLRFFPALLPLSEDEDPVEVLERGERAGTGRADPAQRNGLPVEPADLRGRRRQAAPAGREPGTARRSDRGRLDRQRGVLLRPGRRAGRGRAADLVADVVLRRRVESHRRRRFGLDAEVYWPGVGMVPVVELTLRRLLPMAARGLARWGIESADISRLLAIIEQRCVSGVNGAVWQVDSVRRLTEQGIDRDEALRLMTQDYIELMNEGEPVHNWPAM